MEYILWILTELGLMREDYKHRKKVKAREKKDGRKRPIQKFFLQPSGIYTALSFIVVSAFILAAPWIQKTIFFPRNTQKEILKIASSLEEWKKQKEAYPVDLRELIGNNPMRKNWHLDAWGRPYLYTLTKDGQRFTLRSAGKDGRFETDDDIEATP